MNLPKDLNSCAVQDAKREVDDDEVGFPLDNAKACLPKPLSDETKSILEPTTTGSPVRTVRCRIYFWQVHVEIKIYTSVAEAKQEGNDQSTPSIDLMQLLCMADAFNRYSGQPCTEKAIAEGIAEQFLEGAYLRSRAPVNLMAALHLARRLGNYGLIDLVECARIQQLQACAADLASTLHSMTRYFPAESKEQRNFVLDSRTATLVKLLDDFEGQMADTRDMLALAKTMRAGQPFPSFNSGAVADSGDS